MASRLASRMERNFIEWQKFVEREVPGLLETIDPTQARDIFEWAYASGEQNEANQHGRVCGRES